MTGLMLRQTQAFAKVGQLPGDLPQKIGGLIKGAGSNGIQTADAQKFVKSIPAGPAHDAAARFFAGPYKDFGHHLQAHASGQGFFAGAMFGVAAIISAVVIINVKKSDLPAEGPAEAMVAA